MLGHTSDLNPLSLFMVQFLISYVEMLWLAPLQLRVLTCCPA